MPADAGLEKVVDEDGKEYYLNRNGAETWKVPVKLLLITRMDFNMMSGPAISFGYQNPEDQIITYELNSE